MKKYDIIYADPPWSYRNKNTGGSMKSGASAKYPTMSLEEIKNLPIKNISQKNAVLFLWVTVPLLPEGIQVLQQWGFKYKTMLTWRKIMSLGLGFWFRGQTEHILMGVKGNVKAFRIQKANFYQCKSMRHSQKPQFFRDLISEAAKKTFGEEAKMLEMFARDSDEMDFEGWDKYGNQVADSIIIS